MTKRIPAKTWRFCKDQIVKFPLREAALKDEEEAARLLYEQGGGCKKMDMSGVVSGDFTSSPTYNKYEHLEAFYERGDVKYLVECVEKMRAVIKGLEPLEKEVLEAIWNCGWRDNYTLARAIHMSETTVKNAKRKIIDRLATRWEMKM